MKTFLSCALLILLAGIACSGSSSDDGGGSSSGLLTEDEAVALLEASDCLWDVDDEATTVTFEDPDWVIRSESCLGECRINAETEAVDNDTNPMCTGESS